MKVRVRNRAAVRTRQRQPVLQPGAIPDMWPNGSGLYKQGMAPGPSWKSNENKGLLGRIVRQDNGQYKVWKYMGNERYFYCGLFATQTKAHARITG